MVLVAVAAAEGWWCWWWRRRGGGWRWRWRQRGGVLVVAATAAPVQPSAVEIVSDGLCVCGGGGHEGGGAAPCPLPRSGDYDSPGLWPAPSFALCNLALAPTLGLELSAPRLRSPGLGYWAALILQAYAVREARLLKAAWHTCTDGCALTGPPACVPICVQVSIPGMMTGGCACVRCGRHGEAGQGDGEEGSGQGLSLLSGARVWRSRRQSGEAGFCFQWSGSQRCRASIVPLDWAAAHPPTHPPPPQRGNPQHRCPNTQPNPTPPPLLPPLQARSWEGRTPPLRPDVSVRPPPLPPTLDSGRASSAGRA